MTPPVVSFIARPNHGKTTVIEKVIPALISRGYKIGTIKHHVHHFEMDKPGKDTWRHKQAGAHTVALSSPTSLGIIKDVTGDSSIEDLASHYFSDMDLVLTEGYKTGPMPKIEVFRKEISPSPLDNRDDTWAAFVTDTLLDSDLPQFSGQDITGLASFLIDAFISSSARQKTRLRVDGKVVPLNTFAESFLRQAVLGMVSSLKGCEAPRKLTLTIDNEYHAGQKKDETHP